jgi:hypothetical protein
MDLLEASMAKLLKDIKAKGQQFAVVTAWRAATAKKKNKANLKQMASDIKAKGLSFIKIVGHGQEEDEKGQVKAVKEPSLIVKNIGPGGPQPVMPGKEFDNFVTKLGKKFDQWGIVLKNAKGQMELIKLTGKKPETEMKFQDITVGKASEFFSTLKGKKFVLEYFTPQWDVSGWIEGMAKETKWRKELNEMIDQKDQERI